MGLTVTVRSHTQPKQNIRILEPHPAGAGAGNGVPLRRLPEHPGDAEVEPVRGLIRQVALPRRSSDAMPPRQKKAKALKLPTASLSPTAPTAPSPAPPSPPPSATVDHGRLAWLEQRAKGAGTTSSVVAAVRIRGPAVEDAICAEGHTLHRRATSRP